MAHGGKRLRLIDDINRVRDLDKLLRTDGVNVPAQAAAWEVTGRTIHRYLDALRELVGPTEASRGADLHFLQRYTGKPPKLFA